MSGLDIQPEQSDNDNPACTKAVPGCDTLRVISRFSAKWHEPMAQSFKQVAMSLATWDRFPHGAETLSASRPFFVALSPDTRAFILLRSLYFFFVWQSRADRALTLNMNIQLPLRLFWSTCSRALGPDSATCAGLAHWRDYSYCRA